MSFYTGRHRQTNGVYKKQCHITKGHHDLNIMQGTPADDTVFHSDIQYLEYEMYDLADYKTSDKQLNNNFNLPGTDVSLYDIRNLPNSVYEKITSQKYSWFIYNEGEKEIYDDYTFYVLSKRSLFGVIKYYTSEDACLWAKSNADVFTSIEFDEFTNIPATLPDPSYPYLVLDKNKTLLKFVLIGLKSDGSLSPLNTYSGSDILINNTTFNVNGRNLLNIKYICPDRINNIDKYMLNDGHTFQFINSNNIGSGIELVSNASGTHILKAGHKIITTDIGSTMLDIRSHISTQSISHDTHSSSSVNITKDVPLFNGRRFAEDEVLIITYKFSNEHTDGVRGSGNSSAELFKLTGNIGSKIGQVFKMDLEENNDSANIEYSIIRGSNNTLTMRSELTSNAEDATWQLLTFGGTITIRTLT